MQKKSVFLDYRTYDKSVSSDSLKGDNMNKKLKTTIVSSKEYIQIKMLQKLWRFLILKMVDTYILA